MSERATISLARSSDAKTVSLTDSTVHAETGKPTPQRSMKHCYDKNLALKIGALGSRKPFTSRLAEKQPDASVNAFTAAKRRDVATCFLSCAVDLR